jgi:hypothetical protein
MYCKNEAHLAVFLFGLEDKYLKIQEELTILE